MIKEITKAEAHAFMDNQRQTSLWQNKLSTALYHRPLTYIGYYDNEGILQAVLYYYTLPIAYIFKAAYLPMNELWSNAWQQENLDLPAVLRASNDFHQADKTQSKSDSSNHINTEISRYYQELTTYFQKRNYLFYYLSSPNLRRVLKTDGTIIAKGSFDEPILNFLKSRQYKLLPPAADLNPSTYFVKKLPAPTSSQPETELLEGTSTNLRRMLKRAQAANLMIESVDNNHIHDVLPLFYESANKQGFKQPSRHFIQSLLEAFAGHFILKAVYFDKESKLAEVEAEIKVLSKELAPYLGSDQYNSQPAPLNEAQAVKLKQLQRAKDLRHALKLNAGPKLYVGAAMFYRDHNKIIYHISGSRQALNYYGGIYYLLYQEMLDASQNGMEYFDFGGLYTHFLADFIEFTNPVNKNELAMALEVSSPGILSADQDFIPVGTATKTNFISQELPTQALATAAKPELAAMQANASRETAEAYVDAKQDKLLEFKMKFNGLIYEVYPELRVHLKPWLCKLLGL